MLRVAMETFEVLPQKGSVGGSLLGHKAEFVFMPLKHSALLLDDGYQRICILTSHSGGVNALPISNLYRSQVANTMGLDMDRVLLFSSHNHSCTALLPPSYRSWAIDDARELSAADLTWEGRQVLQGFLRTARSLSDRLVPVTVRYGLGHERRITHNRKGRRADGSTYFMREEDRLKLGVDFCGDIDDDAPVIGFFDATGQPVCFLAQFTGHPVTAYHCEHPVVHGEFPQVACDDLSSAQGGVPVAFLQGCAGDTNSKGLLSVKPAEENVKDAERFGRCLGETYTQVTGSLALSVRSDLGLTWQDVTLPFKDMPAHEALQQRLREVEAFLERCDAGDDPGTRECDGLNFPTNMTPAYRKTLIEPTRQWLLWAMKFHEEQRLQDVPKGVTLRIAALRIGDVGIVGLPCEPLLGIGRQIKRQSPLPLTVPCGYMNANQINYVPDGPNCEDREYISSFYRYRPGLLPYRRPAGDLLARAAVEMLGRIGGGPWDEQNGLDPKSATHE